jgi:SEC-C motif
MAAKEVAMAKVKRNEPCPCGSGNKAKRCCHAVGKVPDVTLKGMFSSLCPEAAFALAGVRPEEFKALHCEMIYLPELDVSLQLRLPGLLTPEIERAYVALQDHDGEGFDDALAQVVPLLDNFESRLELARAVLTLKDSGRIDPKLAAVAIFDLNCESSALVTSSVAESIAVIAGDRRTPSGLLVATG